MPVTTRSSRTAANPSTKPAPKPAGARASKARPKRETEAEREARALQEFKDLMVKYGGKGSFAGFDE